MFGSRRIARRTRRDVGTPAPRGHGRLSMAALLLAGCTPRPDGDVLVPAAYVQGARVVSLHTVTDRGTVLQERPGGPARGFTDARAATL